MTDSSQFNILCRDQLEYFTNEKKIDITLVCGNWSNESEKLKSRNVGRVIIFPIERNISLVKDIYMLFRLVFSLFLIGLMLLFILLLKVYYWEVYLHF